MATTTVRPVNAPYLTTAYSGFFGDTNGSPAPVVTGSGSWSDDSDATATAQRLEPGVSRSAVLAADFAPVPGLLIPADSDPTFGMTMRVTLTSPTGSFSGLQFGMALIAPDGAAFASLLPPFFVPFEIDDPSTFSADATTYTLFDHAATIRDQGFTFAMNLLRSTPPSGVLELTTFEVAFEFNVADAAAPPYIPPTRVTPSLRMLQRGGSGGMSGIPRMMGDPTRRGIRQGPGSIY